MSRVQAIKNHQGKDCRFLNFKKGDIIFVNHKLTGKREDLWAGSIDKHFGYFPKDSVEVEEVFAETEKVLETQESDFFCMDESGYPIDTTNLDSDDHNSQTQEPESTQTSTNTLDKNAQATLMSTEATVKERDNEDGSKYLVDAAEQLRDEVKASATPEEQGGSPSSSWLRSSVTGWLGFGKEEQLRDSEQGEKEDEKEETKPEASIRSSVTGWLGFGGEGKHDSDEDHVEIQEDSLTSTMTRWLGFSEGTETAAIASEEITETANEKEPTEMFRSRRMSLDLEGSKLQEEEEKEDMGTLAWLGSRLSSRLGLGSSPQDSGGEGKETEDQVASSSWMKMRTEGIFGFDDSKSGAGGSTGNGIKETETDQTLEEPPGLENIHIAQSEGSLSEETEKESQIKELENESKPPDSNDGGDTVDSYVDNSDTNDVNILETDVEVSNKDVVGENDIRSQEIDRSLKELDSNSMEQLEGRVEQEGKSLTEGKADVKEQLHTYEESTLMSENSPVRSDDQEEEQLTTEEGLFQQELLKEESPEETEVSRDQGENDEQSKAETESRQGELELQLEMHPTEVSSQNDGSSFYGNPESIYNNISEDDGVIMTLNKTTQTVHETQGFLQTENKEQRDRDVERLEEIVKDQTKLNEKEKTHSEKEVFNESEIKSVVGFERETELTKGSKEEEKLKVKIQEEVKEVEEQIEEVKQESQQKQLEEIKKIEKKKEEELDSVSGEARGLIEQRQDEVKELNEGEKWETVDHEQDRGSKEANEKALNQEKMAEISGDSPSEEFRVERQMDMQEEDKQVPEHGNHIRVEELKESERQNEKEEKGNFSGEGDTKFEEEMQKEAEELKEEEIHENGSQEHEEPILEIPKEFKDPNENQKEEKEKVWGESSREGGKEITEQTQNEDFEPMEEEKTVKNSVELGNHVKVDEFKEYEQNENQEKEGKEQVQENEKINIRGSEIENTKEMLGDSNFPFLVSETNKKTENQNENEEVKVNKAFTEPDKEHPVQEVKDGNVNVGGSEDGGWKDGNWKEDIGFEEEIKKTDNKNSGNEFHRDLGGEESYNPAESQVQGSEQSESAHPPLGTNDKSQERVGAFGLLKNAIELFSQTPNPEMNESTQTVQSFNTNSAETTEPLASFTPGLDALTDSLHTEVTHTGFPKEQAQSHPISAEKLLHNAPSVTEAKTFSKDYKSLHHHMNADETVILLELFGRHKLQFLDYILTSPEAVSADEDQSILSDIEELLQHQMEMLVAPSMKGSDAPEEDKQRTSTIIALQKLETLLKSMKDTVSTGISDVSNHQAGPSSSRTNENEDWSYLEKERDQGSKEKISLHNTKSGSKQKGLIKQSVEFLLWFAEESISSAKAVMGILVWIIVQVRN
uniref:SH3 domain-containing protein n=1 Tax=Cyprinodon variegatus TaxID=28743 RepID=A0A3Q2CB06_CYPVA